MSNFLGSVQKYKLPNVKLPTAEELRELQEYYNQIKEFEDNKELKNKSKLKEFNESER